MTAMRRSIQALVSGPGPGAGRQHLLPAAHRAGRARRVREQARIPEPLQRRLHPPRREGINASINAFIDKIKANGELQKVYDKWMKVPVHKFPDTLEGVPFVAS